MKKDEFLALLERKLDMLPESEVKRSLDYYAEMIDDRIEDGMQEEEAVAALEDIDEIVKRIQLEQPLSALVWEKVKPKRVLKGWELLLLIVGAPLWIPLMVAAACVFLAVYLVIWTAVLALWSVVAALLASAGFGLVTFVVLLLQGSVTTAFFILGAALFCGGLGIFSLFPVKWLSRGLIRLTGRFIVAVKSIFVQKGGKANVEKN